MFFPEGFDSFLQLLMFLAVIGFVALVCSGLFGIYWLFTHVRFI